MGLTWDEHEEHDRELRESLLLLLGAWAIDMPALEAAVAWGDVSGAARAVRLNSATTRAMAGIFATHIQSAFNHAARSEMGNLFNPSDAGVSRAIASVASDGAVAMIARAEETLVGIMRRGLINDTPPEDLAILISKLLWTHDRSAAAAQAQHAKMTEAGMPKKTILAALTAAAGKALLDRIEIATVTSVTSGISQGQLWAWHQMVPLGLLPPGLIVRWVTAADELVCDRCGPLHGVEQPLGTPWWDNGPSVEAPPLHPRCRCHLELTIKVEIE